MRRCQQLAHDLSRYWITGRVPRPVRDHAHRVANALSDLQEDFSHNARMTDQEAAWAIRNGREFVLSLLDSKKTPRLPVVYREAAYRFSKHYPLVDRHPERYRSPKPVDEIHWSS